MLTAFFSNPTPTSVPDLTPRDDTKKLVSETLKRVDVLLKKGDLGQALRELGHAKELDPRNIYTLAFEERIHNLQDQEQEAAETKRVADELAKKKAEEQRVEDEAQRKQHEERQKKIVAERLKAEEEKRKASPVQIPSPPSVKTPSPDRLKLEEIAFANVKSRLDGLDMYRRVLREVWSDGTATEDEDRQLWELRASLSIDPNDHERLEKEVRSDYYLEALKKAMAAGSMSTRNEALLATLRKTYRISQEDHERLQAKLAASRPKETEKKRPSILVIDDDDKLLSILSETIEDSGFDVQAFSTSDEAYALLKKAWMPDLILCDINLESSTMGGFTFYEKVREMEDLADVPFVFLSGLTDEVLVRTGKELGVDDYLTKPISDQNLMATIKGKLKRFKQLKRAKRK